jgi:hypothetical protein
MIHFIRIVTDKTEKGKGGREGERGREREIEGESRRERNSFIENFQV